MISLPCMYLDCVVLLVFKIKLRPLVSTFMHATDGGTKRKASLYPRGHGCVCFIEDALSL